MITTAHKTVLVTGAAGGVGRTICRFLSGPYFQIKGLIRPEDDAQGLGILPENLIKGYVEDSQAVGVAMQGVDVVIHCAALLPNALHLGESAFKRVNVEGALTVLRQAAQQKVSQVIFFSTISVVDHVNRKITFAELQDYVKSPHDAYLSSKIELEKALDKEAKNEPLDVTPFEYYIQVKHKQKQTDAMLQGADNDIKKLIHDLNN